MILDLIRWKTPALGGLALILIGVAPAVAQEPTPTPAASGETRFLRPEPRPPGGAARTVSAPAHRRTAGPALAQAGGLKSLRVAAIGAGEAQVSLPGAATRSVRVGDVLAGDVIREIGDGRIILARPEPGGGESTVVISVDARGQTSIRVISLRLPATRRPAPPAVK